MTRTQLDARIVAILPLIANPEARAALHGLQTSSATLRASRGEDVCHAELVVLTDAERYLRNQPISRENYSAIQALLTDLDRLSTRVAELRLAQTSAQASNLAESAFDLLEGCRSELAQIIRC